jgi:hypothetical protein
MSATKTPRQLSPVTFLWLPKVQKRTNRTEKAVLIEDIMDKDDKKYIKQGHTLISLTEDVPITRDKEVLSKEEVDNEREEKGWVIKRSIFFLRRG